MTPLSNIQFWDVCLRRMRPARFHGLSYRDDDVFARRCKPAKMVGVKSLHGRVSSWSSGDVSWRRNDAEVSMRRCMYSWSGSRDLVGSGSASGSNATKKVLFPQLPVYQLGICYPFTKRTWAPARLPACPLARFPAVTKSCPLAGSSGHLIQLSGGRFIGKSQ